MVRNSVEYGQCRLKLSRQYEARYGRTLSDLDKRNLGIRGFQKGGIVYASEGRGIDGSSSERTGKGLVEEIREMVTRSGKTRETFRGKTRKGYGYGVGQYNPRLDKRTATKSQMGSYDNQSMEWRYTSHPSTLFKLGGIAYRSSGEEVKESFEDIIRRNTRIATGKTFIDQSRLQVTDDPRYREWVMNPDDPRKYKDVEAEIKVDIAKYVDDLYQANKTLFLSRRDAIKGMPEGVAFDKEASIMKSAGVAEATIKQMADTARIFGLSPQEVEEVSKTTLFTNTKRTIVDEADTVGQYFKDANLIAVYDDGGKPTEDRAASHEFMHRIRNIIGEPHVKRKTYENAPTVEGEAKLIGEILTLPSDERDFELQKLTVHLDQLKRLYGMLPETEQKEAALSRRVLSGIRGQQFDNLLAQEVPKQIFHEYTTYDAPAALLSELYHHENAGLQWLKDRLPLLGRSKEGTEKFFEDVFGVLKYQSGGKIPGYGGGDTVPVMAEKGEWIINKEASARYNPILSAINNNTVGRFNQGGKVGYYAAGGRRVDNRELTDTEARSAFRKCVKDIFSTDFLLSKQ